ncbi:histidine phosphatase family protein [Streptomyces sp. NPDC102467]|uniref:histidine phosphatase family protein n=1 Tax=Streptomyces sp. NPDC102467 TaxID=3366179 RepID=UPI00382E01CC
MGDLLLVRHGETEWALTGQHTGLTDIPLTENGREEARRVAPLVGSYHVGAVFVSPLERARETAELAGLHRFTLDPDLREWDYGGYEGVTTREIQRTHPDWYLFDDGVPPGPPEHPGETPEQVGARADRMLSKVDAALSNNEGSVVLVSHGHFLRVLTARRLGLPPSGGAHFLLATGTVSRLSTEHGRPVVSGWNLRPPSS